MPNRILRPGINDSDRVDALSGGAEIFYRRLMSVVDDFGRFEADLRKLRSQCWPKKFDKISPLKVSGWLEECSSGENPLVRVYGVEGKYYLEIQGFDQRVKGGQKSKFPECPGVSGKVREFPASRARTPSPSSTPPKETPPTPKEAGIQPTPEIPDKPIVFAGESQFHEWWALWSKDRGTANRNVAVTTYLSIVDKSQHAALMACTRSYLAHAEPHKGFNPEKFLVEQARDDFTATWAPRKNGRPATVLRDEWPSAAPPQLSPDSEIEKLLAERSKV